MEISVRILYGTRTGDVGHENMYTPILLGLIAQDHRARLSVQDHDHRHRVMLPLLLFVSTIPDRFAQESFAHRL